jgi:hypothetical protein
VITNPLAYLLVNFLDHALSQYEINYPDEENLGRLLSFLGTFLPPRPIKRPQDVVAKVVLANANEGEIRRSKSSWWWEYRLVFECVYGPAVNSLPPDQNITAGADIIDIALKQRIRDDVDREIQTLGYIMQVVDLHGNSRGILGFAVDDPRITSPPFVFRRPTVRGESALPPIVPVEPDSMGRDGRSWTVRMHHSFEDTAVKASFRHVGSSPRTVSVFVCLWHFVIFLFLGRTGIPP